MALKGDFFWIAAIVAATTLGGCSLSPGTPVGTVSIRLKPEHKPTEFLSTLARLPFTVLTGYEAYLGVRSTQDLNCFAVSARPSGVPANRTCDGQIDVGVTSGFQQGTGGVFEMMVPWASSIIFDVIGVDDDPCPSLGSVLGGAPGSPDLFHAGFLSADAGAGSSSEFVIPLGLQTTESLSCEPGGYRQAFFDSFSYGGSALASNGNWTSNGTDFPLSSGALNVGTLVATDYQITRTIPVDRSKTVTLSAEFTPVGPPTGATTYVRMGVGAVSNLPSGPGFGCTFGFTAASPPVLSLDAGKWLATTSINLLTMTASSSALTSSASHTFLLVCEIETLAGTATIHAMGFDLDLGTEVVTESIYSNGDQPTANLPMIYLTNTGQFAAGARLDNFTIGVGD